MEYPEINAQYLLPYETLSTDSAMDMMEQILLVTVDFKKKWFLLRVVKKTSRCLLLLYLLFFALRFLLLILKVVEFFVNMIRR